MGMVAGQVLGGQTRGHMAAQLVAECDTDRVGGQEDRLMKMV
jgi:hypothetical protein